MTVSSERLEEIDRALRALDRSDAQIDAVLARFEDREPDDLAEVDRELAALSEGVEVSSAGAYDPPHAYEPATDPDDEPTVEGAGAGRAEGSRLSAEDLFGAGEAAEPPVPADERPPAPRDYSHLFGPDSDLPPEGDEPTGSDALLASLEQELEGFEPPASDEPTGDDPTGVFSAGEIRAIERDAAASIPPAAEGAHEASVPPAPRVPSSMSPRPQPSVPPPIPSARPPRPPSQRPPARDAAFDALLGDDEAVFRPSQQPPPMDGEPEEGTGDFELLVEEDLLLLDEDAPEDLPADSMSLGEAPSRPEPEEAPAAEEDQGQKKGFFKKLFGGD